LSTVVTVDRPTDSGVLPDEQPTATSANATAAMPMRQGRVFMVTSVRLVSVFATYDGWGLDDEALPVDTALPTAGHTLAPVRDPP
jgi:hypothetical protein